VEKISRSIQSWSDRGVAVVGQRGVRCERGEERVRVAVVDGGNEPAHDGV
jgi:hypothetical protein